MDKELIYGMMDLNMLGSGWKIKSQAKVLILGLMEEDMKGSG
eukprot:CAMPEP_0117004376 /NCGR_PEP_ID=MMETSP0472-20121206/5371_1 /TAXON_ID=693140 ORGANISM="Tiarina fusus, Strain LIS" /NCGR_SAMPLE_ID=MMETSP0472 /ASSEMBLY_ACC=CAM_ASM_000603 /LENGTH=41 /DNA_ID= /DNA_START= /DNA_END= /DNA_ORIENTATION=